jgi:DNA-binding FadR family transcriptional regulator
MANLSLADDLFRKLHAQIRSGAIVPGDRFPTQREIAEQEHVSRTVVREAVARLTAQGLTVSRQGSGVYVAPDARYEAFQVTRDDLSELTEVVKLLEMRLAIETEMASLAAQRRHPDDLAAMRACLGAIVDAGDDLVAAAEADAAFHLAIARATGNGYYERMIEFVGVRLVPPRTLVLDNQSAEERDAYSRTIQQEHDAILNAIDLGDGEGARFAARRHIANSIARHSRPLNAECD